MKKGLSVQTVLIFHSSENVDAHASVAPCTALLICVHIEVDGAGVRLCKSAGICRYAVAVDELAVKRDDIKLGSVRELLGVDRDMSGHRLASRCRSAAAVISGRGAVNYSLVVLGHAVCIKLNARGNFEL